MKKLLLIITVSITLGFTGIAQAWYGPGFYPGMPMYGMFPPMYGMGMYGIPQPSFNYSTVIIQESPPPVIYQEPRIIYRDRYKPCDSECFRRYYSK